MNRSNRKKVVFSHSGVSVLNRRVEKSVEFLKDAISRKNVWTYVEWQDEKSLDDFKERGCYIIEGTRIQSDDGFPNFPCNDFGAMLMVVDTVPVGIVKHKGVVGQLLFMSDYLSGTTILCTRSCKYDSDKEEWTSWDECGGYNAVLYDKLQQIEHTLFPLNITLDISPSIEEYTGNNKNFTISWEALIKGERADVTSITLKVGNSTIPVDVLDTYKDVSASNDSEVTLTIEADGRKSEIKRFINFSRRYYSGVVDSGWLAKSDTVKNLTETALKDKAAITVNYAAATQKKIVFAYPASHGLISSIKDTYGNSMFALNDKGKTFNKGPETVAVTLSSGTTLNYYVYESDVTNVTSGNITYTTTTFD